MKWISVDDQLPEDYSDVFFVEMTAINEYSYPYRYSDAVEKGFYEKGKWYLSDWDNHRYGKDDFLCENVTHWMPLPDSPE